MDEEHYASAANFSERRGCALQSEFVPGTLHHPVIDQIPSLLASTSYSQSETIHQIIPSILSWPNLVGSTTQAPLISAYGHPAAPMKGFTEMTSIESVWNTFKWGLESRVSKFTTFLLVRNSFHILVMNGHPSMKVTDQLSVLCDNPSRLTWGQLMGTEPSTKAVYHST